MMFTCGVQLKIFLTKILLVSIAEQAGVESDLMANNEDKFLS